MISLILVVLETVLKEVLTVPSGGTVYTRWGRKDCPSSAKLVYSGYAGVEPLCLPRDPQWEGYSRYNPFRGSVFGAEYQVDNSDIINSKLHDHDVPCAVCEIVSGSPVIVIPARIRCYPGLKKKYGGYLMAGYWNHKAGSTYSCVDKYPQALHGGYQNHDGKLFYPVEAWCGTLPCPSYRNEWEFTCVVCSKK
ncbi:short-chain collagen C4-like [Saccostrea cucullata]|uniref:short-chain collagen C4-like n=1 Tax=Saccostrea cuccullata TaxID=36930 RepID=UPI002ED10362